MLQEGQACSVSQTESNQPHQTKWRTSATNGEATGSHGKEGATRGEGDPRPKAGSLQGAHDTAAPSRPVES